jgi:membrane carboxypeptidase/penicillin-binding protein PbpC
VPVFYDVIDFLYKGGSPSEFKRPGGIVTAKVCGFSGRKPSQGCLSATEELFIAGTEPKEECTIHRTAERHALPAQYAEWVYDKYQRGSAGGYTIESMPTDLDKAFGQQDDGDSVVRLHGKPQASVAQNVSVSTKHYSITPASETPVNAVFERNTLKITYPLDGDRFIMERGVRTKSIRFTLLSERSVSHVDWFVDGKQCAKSGPPYTAFWVLQKGRHIISTVDPAGNGDSVRIRVE